MALAPGSRLGPYEILGPLGEGGMGEVYRARDPRLGREVAIKTIHETRAGDRDARLRFTRETLRDRLDRGPLPPVKPRPPSPREGRSGVDVASRHLERHPDDVRAIYMIGIELARLEEPARSGEYLERALALDPEDAGTLYNVACGFALLGRTDDALDVLEKAIEKGSANRAWIVNDPDWEGLRGHPRFRALVDPLG